MPLRDVMLEQLAVAKRVVTGGDEVIPAWRVMTADGDYLVLTRFDPDKEGQLDRALHLISRFMAWKLATGYVLSAETWLGPPGARSGQEAITAVGVTRGEIVGVLQRFRRAPFRFEKPEWLAADQVDSIHGELLPKRVETVTAGDAAMLTMLFGEDGEMPAHKLG